MNLVEFLNRVDKISCEMNKKQLLRVLHETARVLPEQEREAFLARLTQSEEPQSPAAGSEADDLEQKARNVTEQLEAMERGELGLYAVPSEDYDDWYDDSEEGFEFKDPAGVLDRLQEAAAFVHQCVDREEFQTAMEIGRRLLEIEILDQGGYLDFTEEPLTLSNLIERNMLPLEEKSLVLEVLYAAYLATEPTGRPKTLLGIFAQYKNDDLWLEDVLQYGQKLPDLDAFLPEWIDCLGQVPTSLAARLLQEAMTLTGNSARMLAVARTYSPRHPSLYRIYLEYHMKSGTGDPAALLQVGMEALDQLDPSYLVRSEVALLSARLAQTIGDPSAAETCWLEAFRSQTNVVNFFRLFMESRDFSRFRPEAEGICSRLLSREEVPKCYLSLSGELAVNRPDTRQIAMLEFLCGKFRLVAESYMNLDKALGWSSTFMKQGIAAFLLLMLRGDSLGRGCREMRRLLQQGIQFTVEEYNQGLREEKQQAPNTDLAWFWTCFSRWKSTVSLSEQGEESCLQWIEERMEKRVARIMANNRRNYYGECAAFLAAIGEVRESWGETGAKQKLLLTYQGQYSRRRSFMQELRAYGMVDLWKKK